MGGRGVLVDVGVESVDGVSGVVHGPDGAVRFGEGVAALDDISVTAFSLTLGVSGQRVLDAVGERVGRVWVVLVGYGDWRMGQVLCLADHQDCSEDGYLLIKYIFRNEIIYESYFKIHSLKFFLSIADITRQEECLNFRPSILITC